jgi:hypothetical protein
MNKVEYSDTIFNLNLQRFKMRNVSAPEFTSYAGSVTAIGASMTLTNIGILIGIVTALLTCALNIYFMRRKDQREQRESDARMALLSQKEDVVHG